MKKPLIIGVSALVLLASATLLFAQTTTGSSVITQMKAAVHAFTLAGDLNPGTTGLDSAPLVGKKTGDMLSAGEYNRILELVGMGGSGNIVLNTPVTVDELTLLPVGNQARSIDLSTKTSVPAGSTHAVVNIHCGVCSGNPGACNSPNNPESIVVKRTDGKTMCRAYSGLLKSGNQSIDSYNGDMDTNTTYIALESDGKTIKYNVEQNNNGDGEQGHVEVLGFVTNATGGGSGGGSTGGSGWVDVGLTGTENFDVACDYRMRSTGEPAGWTHAWIVRESYVAFNVSTVDASLIALIPKEEKGFWDYHRNGNLATKVQEDVLAVTHLQKLCVGGGGGGGTIVKQISGSTPPNSSNYIALCNDNTTLPTMNGYGPLPVYWNSTTQKWIGRRIEIPTAGSGANVSGYMFDCPSLWIAE